MPDYDMHLDNIDVLLNDEIQFSMEIKIPNLIYSPFEKFKTRFFQNKKANKEKKVIGKKFKKKIE